MNMCAVNRPPMFTIVYPSAASRPTSTAAVALVRISLPSVPPKRRWSRGARRAFGDRFVTAPPGSDRISMRVMLRRLLHAVVGCRATLGLRPKRYRLGRSPSVALQPTTAWSNRRSMTLMEMRSLPGGAVTKRSPKARRAPRLQRRFGGTEGNEILTSATAAVLVGLLAAEGYTIVNIGGLLTAHMFIGLVLIPPVLVKLASTGY